MMKDQDLTRQDIQVLKKEISVLSGRRAELADRADSLTQDVGKAKGALELRDDTEGFLERLQHSYHEKTLGSYERLLTAVTEDVMGVGNKIKLDLFTERGAPALDIRAEIYDPADPNDKGFSVDLLSGSGLSMTNVISMGLRCIATLRSGLRPFLALDETDIWLSSERVGGFYNVLEQLSNEHGLQALVISHHKVNVFGPNIRVLEVVENTHARDGVRVVVRSWGRMWENETQKGIRSIRLRDFASFHDGTFPLGPGLNVIIGENNLGKSRVMWALRGVAYGGNESHDSFIRRGKKRTDVDIMLENNMHLSWSREQKRNPVTLWTLEDATHKIMEINGQFCSTGGKNPPEWLEPTLGIGRVDGLEIQLSRQIKPVFLMDETPSKRASVLSMGRESNYLRTMIDNYKEICKANQSVVKDGEKELTTTLDKLSRMVNLPVIEKSVDSLFSEFDEIAEKTKSIEKLKALHGKILDARMGKQQVGEKLIALQKLGTPLDITSSQIQIARLQRLHKAIVESNARISNASQCLVALSRLQDIPQFTNTVALRDIWSKITTKTLDVAKLEMQLLALTRLTSRPNQTDISHVGLEKKIRSLINKKSSLKQMLAILANIPAIPVLTDVSNIKGMQNKIEILRDKKIVIEKNLLELEDKLLTSRVNIETLLSKQGNKCTTCGSDVTFDKLHERICMPARPQEKYND
jgi:DNA repair ATPase RecN